MVYFLQRYGYSLLFSAALAENLGLPVPSYPLILLGAALSVQLHLSLTRIFAVTALASFVGDGAWYVLGRYRGRPILRTLCSISLNPDSCVSRTENFFVRHGLKSLLIAKFIPGLNTVAPPLAGMLKVSPLRYAAFDLGGIALWISSALLLGKGFRSQVVWVMDWLRAFGSASLLIISVVLAGWILMKWLDRRRFYRLLEKSRISSPELKERLDRGEDIVIVDLRSDLDLRLGGSKIPKAIHILPREFEARYTEIPRGRPVVMYCS
jgi:membrane protein DedA with SNARE-associated domain